MGVESSVEIGMMSKRLDSMDNRINTTDNNNVELRKELNIVRDKVEKIQEKSTETTIELTKLSMQYESLNASLLKISQDTSCMSTIKNSIDRLNEKMEESIEEGKSQRLDINKLKDEPAKKTYETVGKVTWLIISCLVTIILGGVYNFFKGGN